MSTIIINGTRTIEDAQAATPNTQYIYTLGSGNNLLVGPQAFLAADLNGTGIVNLTSSNSVVINGTLYADGSAIAASTANGYNSIKLAGSAVVSSVSFSAYVIDLQGQHNSIVNAGLISGSRGIHVEGSAGTIDNTITNTGLISGDINALYLGTGPFQISNSGTMTTSGADGEAIRMIGIGTLLIDNSGTISGAYGISIGSASTYVIIHNSGTISGVNVSLDLYDGADTIINTGHINGNVNLYGGNDLFDSSLGTMIGVVDGYAGDDVLIGSVLGDQLLGGSDNDMLSGNAGNDVLDGGSGADVLDGGAGIDTASYHDSMAPLIVDLATPDVNTGDAVGDSYVSVESLTGAQYCSSTLYGNAGVNVLTGGEADDILDGRTGADTLIGGTGNDSYVVDNSHDRTVELAAQGTDTVNSSVTWTLGDNLEQLTLTGAAAINGFGNALDNVITGNGGANILDGLLGNDTLTGGGGADNFRFSTPLDATGNVDTIIDFVHGTDKIQLLRPVFNLGTTTALNPAFFYAGSTAHDSNDHIIYDPSNGNLYYDTDGTGSAAQVLFAHLTPGLAIDASDFMLGK